MKPSALAEGQVAALTRTLPRCPDPVQLLEQRCPLRGGAFGGLLLESADHTAPSGEKSLVITRAALHLEAHGREVTVRALSTNGRNALSWLRSTIEDGPNKREPPAIEASDDAICVRYPQLEGGSEQERLTQPSPLDVVRKVLASEHIGGEASWPPLVAGCFSYDLLAAYETLPDAKSDPLGWPDFELWLAEELVWIQHNKRSCTMLRFVYGGDDAERAHNDATNELASLSALVERELGGEAPISQHRIAHAVSTDMSDDEYAALVATLKKHIVAGDVFQIVPSRTFSAPCSQPVAAYCELRALNPSPYMFLLRSSRGTLFGASPETALAVKGTPRRVVISPIAGTRRRGFGSDEATIDADLDTRIEAELRLDEKEVAEHMMLVDLARNDVARVSVPGTRAVDQLLDVVRYSHVMHLVSLVSGRLAPSLDALHAYVATMNMGTLVGAPKLRAAELLRQHEPTRRGPYGGAVGYMTASGEMDTCIVIRAAVVKDGIAHVRAGAGVVHDSVPSAEADETRRKAQAVLEALHRAAGAGDRSGEAR